MKLKNFIIFAKYEEYEIYMTKDYFISSEFIRILTKNYKLFLWITLISALASILFSSSIFITPKYKSTVVMFPVSTNSISKSLLSENPGSKTNLMEFGEEDQAEQLLQILNSSEIRNRIIKQFHLMEHYDIDSTSRYKISKINTQYKSDISFKRNEYMAVEINVYDKDAQMAADIANTIAALVDTVKNNMLRQRTLCGFKIVQKEYTDLLLDTKMLADSLSTFGKLGLTDYSSQVEMIRQQLSIELVNRNSKGVKQLEEKLSELSKYAGSFLSIQERIINMQKQISFVKLKFDEAKIDATQVIPHKFVVDYAYKSDKKAYPIRWLIVTITTLSALLLSYMVLLIKDQFSKHELI